jgi:UDP-N-acetylmuramoyl-tripeptide--D-alanyl-D-alanine ligase
MRYAAGELAAILGAETTRPEAEFTGVSTDTRTIEPGQAFFALSGENFDGNRFVAQAFAKGAAVAVTSAPHEGGACVVVDNPLAALQQFAASHRARFRIPVLALTGSCGKTSTKDLIASVLETKRRVVKTQGNLNNDIGCPLSLLRIEEDTEFAVIEMGANHRGEIAAMCEMARPTESLVTMVAPAHLEGFGSVENVAKAKGEIVEALGPGGVFYANAGDPWCRQMAEDHRGDTVWIGGPGEVGLESCAPEPGGMRLTVRPIGELRLPLLCRAHGLNVAFAVAAGLRHGVTEFEDPLRRALKSAARFKLLEVGPLTVIDDTYNANPASVAAALEALADRAGAGRTIAVLGDMFELGEEAARLHRECGERAAGLGIGVVLAMGENACDTIAGARLGGAELAESSETHHELAATVHRLAEAGDTVLVKGSRGMRMERVIDALADLYPPQG